MIRVEIRLLTKRGPVRGTQVEQLHIENAGSAGAGAANYKVWAGADTDREPDAWVFAHPAIEGASALAGKALAALQAVGCIGECVL